MLAPVQQIPATPVASAQAANGATLSILAQPVEVALGGGRFGPASDGQALGPGDVVRTGASGVALLTFFNGSESQVTSNSQVQLEQASSQSGAPSISLLQA